MNKSKLYVPQYTNTGRIKGEPKVRPRQSEIKTLNKNEYSSGANNDVSHENPASSKHMNSSTLENIPEIKSASAGLGRSTKLLVVFGSVVIACAVAAIAVSVGLYVSRSCSTSSNSGSSNSNSGLANTTTTTTATYTCANFTVTQSWDYPNNDIANASPMTFSVCCAWCLATSTCRSFALTISSSTCWIKTTSGGAGVANSNTIGARL